jgi:hypothetical protein
MELLSIFRIKNEQKDIIFSFQVNTESDSVFWEECMLHGLPASCCYHSSVSDFISEIKRRKSYWTIEKSTIQTCNKVVYAPNS